MLNEEENEAIETVEFLKKKKWYEYAGDNGTEILDEEEKKDVDIVLNLIKKQQKLINTFIHNEAVREGKDFNEIKEKYYECL